MLAVNILFISDSFTEGLAGALIGAIIAIVAAYLQFRFSRTIASEQRKHETIQAWCAKASQAISSATIVAQWIQKVDQTYLRSIATHPNHPWTILSEIDNAIREIQEVEILSPDKLTIQASKKVRRELFALKLHWLNNDYYDNRVQNLSPGDFRDDAKDAREKYYSAMKETLDSLLGIQYGNSSIKDLRTEIHRLANDPTNKENKKS